MKKRTIILSLLVIIAISFMAYSTYAFFSSNDKVTNVFTVGKTKIDLTEPSWNDTTDGNSMVPGTDLIKDPTLVGIEGKSYARVIVELLDKNDNVITNDLLASYINQTIFYDKTYNANNNPKTTVLVKNKQFTKTELNTMLTASTIAKYNSTDFTLDTGRSSAGHYVYNYNSILNAGESKVLFTNVIIPSDYVQADLDQLGEYKIRVKAEAIQSEGFTNSTDAFNQLDVEA